MTKTQTEARRFFIDKIVEQARAERIALSDDERQMLSWSESAPDSIADPDLVERLGAQISDQDYEIKIAGLLRRRFAEDRSRNAGAKDQWQQAWTVLKQGDHYILVMIDEAIGRELKPWWRIW